ncbi:MAG: helix-turn-helix domain-containing protein [Sterolibacteriaceae bacterium]|nr:helix-turn-helix domain-containing protein [Sterolibacteriaceae bacterium]
MLGVAQNKRGPRGAHRFTAEKRARAAQLLDQGSSIRQAAGQVGVTEGTIRRTLRRGELGRAARRQASLPAGPASAASVRRAVPVAWRCSGTPNAHWRAWDSSRKPPPSLWRPRRCATGVLYWRCRRCWRWGCWRRASRPMVR